MFSFKNFSNTSAIEAEVFRPEGYQCSHQEFLAIRRQKDRTFVFDLRNTEDYEQGHLPGAHSLPISHFENAIYQMPYEGEILLYGAGNGEAQKSAEILYENGFETFRFVDDYQALMDELAHSPFEFTAAAQSLLQGTPGIQIRAEAISPKRASFSVKILNSDELSQAKITDIEIIKDGISVLINTASLLYLEGSQIDGVATDSGMELIISNHEFEVPPLQGDARERMVQLIEEKINPSVASHGGFVNLVDIQGTRVFLEFGGGCKGCGGVNQTLKYGVETIVKENIPGITEILDITDHANGTNPYYRAA